MKQSKAQSMRKQLIAIALLIITAIIMVIFLWSERVAIRDWYSDVQKPVLPAEQTIIQPGDVPVATTTKATTTKPQAKPIEPSKNDPVSVTPAVTSSGEFPKELNLSVPFVLQAPFQNWVLPYEEACEEASLIMAVNAGKKAPTATEADKLIKALVARQNELFGDYFHTSAKQTAELAKDFFDVKETRIFPITSADDIKRELAAGHPVLVPADGKLLKNPNFKNGGPIYHMLLIKGYLADGRWITNDPGTRNGKDYLYGKEQLLNAIHDWTGDAANGARVGLIVVP
ncbi:MAG: C39 family peptidase [Candidatus Magasanikbacteria bacterium]|nr:C39 family peptidase [Candidatus Magasanikbacteria bacterium]